MAWCNRHLVQAYDKETLKALIMDTRNYCIDCDTPKPCMCDLKEHKFDTSSYVVLNNNLRIVDTNKYDIILKDN